MAGKVRPAPPAGGLLILRKPAGPTSMQMLSRVRKLSGIRKLGHCGTLDPFADGVLPIALGRATNMIRYMDDYDKVYRVLIHLGEATDTQDLSGRVIGGRRPGPEETEALLRDGARLIREAMAKLTGRITQETPLYSAAKIDGRPMYDYARKGIAVEGKKREVEIYSAVLVGAGAGSADGAARRLTKESLPGASCFPGLQAGGEGLDEPREVTEPALWLAADISCSKGTYIRTWADDLGKLLGTGAYAARLRRLKTGPFCFEESVTLEELEEKAGLGFVFSAEAGDRSLLVSAETARPDFPVIELDKTCAVRLLQGKSLSVKDLPEAAARFRARAEGCFLGIVRRDGGPESGTIVAERMFTDIENFACRSEQASE